MLFDTLPELSHELVRLRPIVESDLPVWYAYLSRPDVNEHTSWNLSGWTDLSPYMWNPEANTESSLVRLAIALRSNDELVGTAGFHTVQPRNRSAEIAYDLAPSQWGKGIATSVCQQLVAWAHSSAKVLRVQGTVLQSNVRSMAVLERCGFLREGLLRSYRLVRGKPGDFYMYSHVVPLSTVA
jgi:RimJ/RimL family protein N-acetyltransferase